MERFTYYKQRQLRRTVEVLEVTIIPTREGISNQHRVTTYLLGKYVSISRVSYHDEKSIEILEAKYEDCSFLLIQLIKEYWTKRKEIRR